MSMLVVKKHRAFATILAVVFGNAVLSFVVWLLLDVSHRHFIESQISQNEDHRLLLNAHQNLENENKTLRDKIITLERLLQVDKQIAVNLQNEIKALQDDVYRLKGELEFYEGIMSATTESKGLNIQGLHIEATGPKQYHFKLILTNVAKNANHVKVTLDMSIEGMGESGSQTLPLDKVIAGSKPNVGIEFKHFERIEGSLHFPPGFTPLRAIVDLRRKGSQKSIVKRVFKWPVNMPVEE